MTEQPSCGNNVYFSKLISIGDGAPAHLCRSQPGRLRGAQHAMEAVQQHGAQLLVGFLHTCCMLLLVHLSISLASCATLSSTAAMEFILP